MVRTFPSPLAFRNRRDDGPVDALMVGTSDLRLSLGLTPGSMDGDEPCFLDALNKIQRAADANGLAVLGFAVTPDILERRIKLGWRAFVCHADVSGIFGSGTLGLKAYRMIAGEIARPVPMTSNVTSNVNVNGGEVAEQNRDGVR